MPEYQHSCFISYKHPPARDILSANRHFWMEFIVAFQAKLEAFITIDLKTYRDDQLHYAPGVKYPTELSRRLCQSACMVAVLVPEYLESSWCRAEWNAMEQLEQARTLDSDVGGFIIPILFRGHSDKIAQFCNGRMFIDFSHIVKPSTELNSKDSRKKIESIAQRIAELAKSHSSNDCSNFIIDIGEEIAEPGFDDPDPLR